MREINADLLTYERFEGEIDPATGLEVDSAPAFGLDGATPGAPQPTDG
jgi:hypothetical protein